MSTIFTGLVLYALLVALLLVRAHAHAQREDTSRGIASWYGESYRGKPMANGQPFNPDALTCAAWHWPLGTALSVRYQHPKHGYRSVVVTVTDRGPDKRLGRLVDLSSAAFRHLVGSTDAGIVTVEVTVVGGAE